MGFDPTLFRASLLRTIYESLDRPPQFRVTDFDLETTNDGSPTLSIRYRHAFFRFSFLHFAEGAVLCSIAMNPGETTVEEHVSVHPSQIHMNIAGWLVRLAEDLASDPAVRALE